MNWFLDMLGLRQFVTRKEIANWKRQGIKMNVQHERLKTELHPANVEYEEIIRSVLFCNHGEKIPITDLFLAWQAVEPSLDFARLIDISHRVMVGISAESNKSNQKDEFIKVDTANA